MREHTADVDFGYKRAGPASQVIKGRLWLVRQVDPTIKRILVVAAGLYVALCSGIPVALGVGVAFGVIEFEAWQVPVVVACILGLWRFIAWLKPDKSDEAAVGDEPSADDSPPTTTTLAARTRAALRARFKGWR